MIFNRKPSIYLLYTYDILQVYICRASTEVYKNLKKNINECALCSCRFEILI
jgi:hypothetical protein